MVVGTGFHKGRIMVSFHPHSGQVETGRLVATSVKNATFDYSPESNIFSYEVPYYSVTPWEPISNKSDDVYKFSQATPTLSHDRGSLTITVVNALSVSNNIPNNVSIVTMIQGGSDIMFDNPYRGWPTLKKSIPQAGEISLTGQSDLTAGRDATTVKIGKELFHGDFEETHLKALLRRKNLIQSIVFDFKNATQHTIKYINRPIIGGALFKGSNIDATPAPVYQTLPSPNLAFYSMFYAFWSGPLRYVFLTTATKLQGVICQISHDPRRPARNGDYLVDVLDDNDNDYSDDTNLGFEVEQLSTNPVMSVEAPFAVELMKLQTADNNYQATGIPYVNDLSAAGEISVTFSVVEKQDFRLGVQVYQSAGDSFTLSTFIGSPYFNVQYNLYSNFFAPTL